MVSVLKETNDKRALYRKGKTINFQVFRLYCHYS